MGSVGRGGEAVAGGARQQHEPQAEAWSERATRRGDEDDAARDVADGVRQVGMQRERGHGAPDLAAENLCRVGAAGAKPERRRGPGTRQGVEGEERRGEHDPGGRPAILLSLGNGRNRCRVLALELRQLRGGAVTIVPCDAHGPAGGRLLDPVGNARGRQYQRPFVGLSSTRSDPRTRGVGIGHR
jgi:hypothetical protein